MAIDKAKIKNYQFHSDTILEFHKGLNIIHGDNAQGKSGILRAINWCACNKPQGFSFKKRKTTEGTKVTLQVNDNIIIRKRNESENIYQLNKTAFKAIKSNVPEEIEQTLNLSEYYYRSQHDQCFLFNESDGEVARKINKVVGINLITEVMQKLRSLKDNNTKEINQLTADLLEHKAKFDSFKGLKQLKEQTKKIEIKTQKTEQKEKTHTSLSKLIEQIKMIQVQVNNLKPLTQAEKQVKQANKKYIELKNKIVELNNLFNLINSYKTITHKLAPLKNIINISPRINKIQKRVIAYTDKEKDLQQLKNIIKDIKANTKINKEIANNIKELEKQKKIVETKLKICFICKKPF